MRHYPYQGHRDRSASPWERGCGLEIGLFVNSQGYYEGLWDMLGNLANVS